MTVLAQVVHESTGETITILQDFSVNNTRLLVYRMDSLIQERIYLDGTQVNFEGSEMFIVDKAA